MLQTVAMDKRLKAAVNKLTAIERLKGGEYGRASCVCVCVFL